MLVLLHQLGELQTGLFSATLPIVQDLRPNRFYPRGHLPRRLAERNTSRRASMPPPFSPPRYAIWVDLLWSLSLVRSVSCVL